MKRVLSKIKYIVALPCVAMMMSSCEDFLSTVPLNEIVLENFWENESEVNSVVYSCYSRMAQGDFLTRLMLWGELRSENVVEGAITGDLPYVDNNDQLKEMLKGNILQNYYIADWSCFYNVINRCNTVLHYAPDVLDRDPEFKQSEWLAIEAEMLTLRALCYFYLVRSFRDVPLVLEPTIDDSKPFVVAAATPDSVLNQLVADLKKAEVNAVVEYPETSGMYTYTKSRVTKQAVWALLADVLLWMERYDECIVYCEKVIEAKIADAEEEQMTYSGEYPLLANQRTGSMTNVHSAYASIFGTGFSFESIFEMPFGYNYEDKRDALRSYYGAWDRTLGCFSASTFIAEGNELYGSNDIRKIEAFDANASSIYPINKYVATMIDYDSNTKKHEVLAVRGTSYSNWIFYRLTDVMLMEAEARVERNDSAANDLRKAFNLAAAVYHRANILAEEADTLKFNGYSTQNVLRDFVLEERHRELMFEGKRWFDLVRKARREGSTSAMLDLATRKYTNPGSVKSKWIKPDMLYLPYHENELKVNTLLEQNPEYKTDETVSTAK